MVAVHDSGSLRSQGLRSLFNWRLAAALGATCLFWVALVDIVTSLT